MKKVIYIILIIFSHSFPAHSMECPEEDKNFFDDLISFLTPKPWWAAEISDIKSAHCSRRLPFSNGEIDLWLTEHESKQNKNEKIHGISFENESPENLKAFKNLTTATTIFGPDVLRQKTFSSKCQKVACAVKEIFGKDEGPRLLFMNRRYGLNGSHFVRSDTIPFEKGQLDTILLSLSDFPDGTLPLAQDKMIMRAPKFKGNRGVLANAAITVFEKWEDYDEELQRSTITHEMGHVIGMDTKLQRGDKWLEAGGWITKSKVEGGQEKKETELKNSDLAISKYGETNSAEDFAESVVAYRYNPKKLKEKAPKKYEIIKKHVFDGIEYTTKQSCENPTRISDKTKKEIESKIDQWHPTNEEMIQMMGECTSLLIKKSLSGSVKMSPSNELNECYHKSIKQIALKAMTNLKSTSEDEKPFNEFILRNISLQIPEDIVQKISGTLLQTHEELFENEINKALKKPFACSNNFQKYFYQDIDGKKMGFDPYYYRAELEQIAVKKCQTSTKDSQDGQNRELENLAEELRGLIKN